ncbi:PAS domain-containing protein [Neolewinella aurantiaca]|uniref:PAS domain-containing protein n=1 Tax=Neolewinella aurantiaca TaxID=2602767 RepID=A0A5C7FJR5_9BACT|nr:PAS domain-containing protein [Neolewinella aurantiaca]TXF91545.1 PAS domain-containing protein [Neolewinella aurantiaca]
MNRVAVILTDANRRILWVNQDFEFVTGYETGEVIGKSPGHILQGPQTEPDAIQRIKDGLASEEPFKETITNHRKNGEAYLCKLVIHPIHNAENKLVNYIAFEVDGDRVVHDHRISLLNLKDRYRTSSLRGLDELRLFERIKEVMATEKLYLNPDLTLRKLSLKLDTNTKYLSQVINHHGGTNFLSFINSFRIEAVVSRIKAGEFRQHTFFGIAQRCGFKNKSTFYKVFREMTNSTPKAYAEKISSENVK